MLQALGKISRLKGFFRSGINYSCYEEILGAVGRKASGRLPTDILSRLISNGGDKKSAIQGTEKLFNEAVDILGDISKLEIQAINRMPQTTSYLERMLYFFRKDVKGFFRLDSLYREKELETIIKAEEKILIGIKKYIPEVNNVVITPLGCGMFGNGYKLQVLGNGGKQIFGDKVLKVYREKYLMNSFAEKSKRYADILSDENLVELYNKERVLYKKLGVDMPELTSTKIREKLQKDIIGEDVLREVAKEHGAMAEANASEFLRFFSGHKVKAEEGIAIPSYFGLGKTKFSLGEFIGKGRKAEREFNFEKLFTQYGDYRSANNVNGICVDMGGIVPLVGIKQPKEIFSSKENMRIMKSLWTCPKDKMDVVLDEYKKAGTLSNELLTILEQIVKAT